MLLSMTGFGEARRESDTLAVAVEVRTINSRYFKLSVRCGEGYTALEPQIENVVRGRIKRGTVQVSLRIDRAQRREDFRLNPSILAGYWEQIEAVRQQLHFVEPVRLDAILLLPGVVRENAMSPADLESDWPAIGAALEAALTNMDQMRLDEGRAMAADLITNCSAIASELDGIARRAPQVAEIYRQRLSERVSKAMAEFQVSLEPGDLVREISIYAERSDISEEVVRLRSHLEQFSTIMALEESSGRKLDFLTQEMFREANTIGSKANDVQIARHVIEIKAAIERIREMIQNIE